MPAGREDAAYQRMLRALGAYLDERAAGDVCVIETPEGFTLRFAGEEGSVPLDGSPAKLMNRIWVAMPMLEMLFCYAARKTRCRSRSKFARPYMVRLISLSRFTWPSVWPLLHTIVSPARTAASSASSPVAKRWSC